MKYIERISALLAAMILIVCTAVVPAFANERVTTPAGNLVDNQHQAYATVMEGLTWAGAEVGKAASAATNGALGNVLESTASASHQQYKNEHWYGQYVELVNSGASQDKIDEFVKKHPDLTNPITGEKVKINSDKADEFLAQSGEDVDNANSSLGPIVRQVERFVEAKISFLGSLQKIQSVLKESPAEYNNATWLWVVNTVAKGFIPAGVSLVMIFFGFGMLKSSENLLETKRTELVLQNLLRLVIAYGFVIVAPQLCQWFINVGIGLIQKLSMNSLAPDIAAAVASGKQTQRDLEILDRAKQMGTFNLESIHFYLDLFLMRFGMKIMSFLILAFCAARFLKMYIYVAISPLPLSTLASEPTQQHAYSFLKSLAGVLLEGLVILLTLQIFVTMMYEPADKYQLIQLFNPSGDSSQDEYYIYAYAENIVVQMLVCGVTVFGVDRLVSKAFGV